MAEEFLDYQEITEHRHVTVTGFHLGGDATHWLRWFKLRFLLSSWATFTTQLLQRFGPTDSLNINMALSHITQTTTWRRMWASSFAFLAVLRTGPKLNYWAHFWKASKTSCKMMSWPRDLPLWHEQLNSLASTSTNRVAGQRSVLDTIVHPIIFLNNLFPPHPPHLTNPLHLDLLLQH
ncbi:hypothetical protein FF1_024876 [Malus domestica]